MSKGKEQQPTQTMAEAGLKTYRITYTNGRFVTLWSGKDAADAIRTCADYYNTSPIRLRAKEEK